MKKIDVPGLLDAAKTSLNVESDNQLANALDVTRQAISLWRGGRTPDAEGAIKLAQASGANPLEILAACEFERSRAPNKKAFWASVAERGGSWRKR